MNTRTPRSRWAEAGRISKLTTERYRYHPALMAVPKKRTSRTRRDKRRATHGAARRG